jgi:hypothetical protein
MAPILAPTLASRSRRYPLAFGDRSVARFVSPSRSRRSREWTGLVSSATKSTGLVGVTSTARFIFMRVSRVVTGLRERTNPRYAQFGALSSSSKNELVLARIRQTVGTFRFATVSCGSAAVNSLTPRQEPRNAFHSAPLILRTSIGFCSTCADKSSRLERLIYSWAF